MVEEEVAVVVMIIVVVSEMISIRLRIDDLNETTMGQDGASKSESNWREWKESGMGERESE